MSLFSIVIPCYNLENHLSETIQSILAQKASNYEVILINDGSTDRTLKLMQHYQTKDNFTLVNNVDNKGVSHARNQGLMQVKGKYVLFLDGDDTLHPDLLKDLETFIKKHPDLDMISFGYGMYDSEGVVKDFCNQKLNKKIKSSESFLSLFLKRKVKQHLCSMVVKSSIIKKENLFFEEKTFMGEDQEFQIKAIFHSRKIAYLSKRYFYYNVREDSVMNSHFNKKRLTSLNVFDRLHAYLSRHKASKAILKNLVTYSSIEFFSVLNKTIKSNNKQFLHEFLKKDKVIYLKGRVGLDYFSIMAVLLKNVYRLNPKLLFSVLTVI